MSKFREEDFYYWSLKEQELMLNLEGSTVRKIPLSEINKVFVEVNAISKFFVFFLLVLIVYTITELNINIILLLLIALLVVALLIIVQYKSYSFKIVLANGEVFKKEFFEDEKKVNLKELYSLELAIYNYKIVNDK